MLVLTRKLQQQIKIGEQITVTILRVKGNTVRVGITAPRDVRVIRGELPKTGAAVESETLTVDDAASVVSGVTTIAADEEGADESGCQADEQTTLAASSTEHAQAILPIAAHLPLRKIANRHGNAPLKRIVAACSTLAK